MGRILSLLLVVVLLCGCNSPKGNNIAFNPVSESLIPERGVAHLTFTAVEIDDTWFVELHAREVTDLYQIAGSISYPGEVYEIERIDCGGGLGSPMTSYFVGRESTDNQIDFAYTMRDYGTGQSGNVKLLTLKVKPNGAFVLGDFQLLSGDAKLVIRDSNKNPLNLELPGGAS